MLRILWLMLTISCCYEGVSDHTIVLTPKLSIFVAVPAVT